jgi:ribosomal small subunit protein bTHX
MGRGDKRTFKGKVFKGSYGKSRVRKARKTRDTAAAKKK